MSPFPYLPKRPFRRSPLLRNPQINIDKEHTPSDSQRTSLQPFHGPMFLGPEHNNSAYHQVSQQHQVTQRQNDCYSTYMLSALERPSFIGCLAQFAFLCRNNDNTNVHRVLHISIISARLEPTRFRQRQSAFQKTRIVAATGDSIDFEARTKIARTPGYSPCAFLEGLCKHQISPRLVLI